MKLVSSHYNSAINKNQMHYITGYLSEDFKLPLCVQSFESSHFQTFVENLWHFHPTFISGKKKHYHNETERCRSLCKSKTNQTWLL